MDTVRPDRRPRRRGRVREWVNRYAPAEVGALVGAVLGAAGASPLDLPAATAYAGAFGEAVGFWGVLLVRGLRRRRRCGQARRSMPRTMGALLLEFGPAELLDSLAVRPLAMYVGPLIVGNLVAGIVVGKIAADVVFYALAIVGYELGRTLIPKPTPVPKPTPTTTDAYDRAAVSR